MTMIAAHTHTCANSNGQRSAVLITSLVSWETDGTHFSEKKYNSPADLRLGMIRTRTPEAYRANSPTSDCRI